MVNVSVTGSTGGGTGVFVDSTSSWDIQYCNAWDNAGGAWAGGGSPFGSGSNPEVDPVYVDVTDKKDPMNWDLQLDTTSPLIDAGDPKILDPDKSTSDIGAYGGPGAADW